VRTTVYSAKAVVVVEATLIEKVMVDGAFVLEGSVFAVATTSMSMVPEAASDCAVPTPCVSVPEVTMIWLLEGLTNESVVVTLPAFES
jgi:hypothetical protein